VYVDGARVSPDGGVAAGRFAPAGHRAPGPATIAVFRHVEPVPATPAGRTDPVATATVTVPDARAATIVVGPSPGTGGAPAVAVHGDDRAPVRRGTARLVVRPTLAGGRVEAEVVALYGTLPVTVGRRILGPGDELAVDVLVGPGGRSGAFVRAAAEGASWALPERFSQMVPLVGGEVHTVYATGQRRPARPPVPCASTTTAPPAGAGDVSTAEADLDGDGRTERASLWSREGRWHLGAGGAVADLALPTGTDGASRLLGAADADGDGTDELFAGLGRTTWSEVLQVWSWRDCALAPLRDAATGDPLTFAVGSAARDKVGLSCAVTGEPPALLAWRAKGSEDRATFTASVTRYRWTGPNTLAADPEDTRALPREDVWTPLEAAALRCGRPPYGLVTRVGDALSPRGPAAVVTDPAFTG
jgi:hypothetical protein